MKLRDTVAVILLWALLIVGLSWNNYHLFTDSSYYLDCGRRFFETGKLETGVNLFQFWDGPTRSALTLYSPLLCLFMGGVWCLGHSLDLLAFVVTYLPFLALGILFFHHIVRRLSRPWAYGGVAALFLLPAVQFTSGFAGWEPTGVLATIGLLALWKLSLRGRRYWTLPLGLGIAAMSLWAMAVPLTVALALVFSAPFFGRDGWKALWRVGVIAILAAVAWQLFCFSTAREFYPQWRPANKTSDLFEYYGGGSYVADEPVTRISAATWAAFYRSLPHNIINLTWLIIKAIVSNVGLLPLLILAGISQLYRRRFSEPLPFVAALLSLAWVVAIPPALHWRLEFDLRFSLIPSLALLYSGAALLPDLLTKIEGVGSFRRAVLLWVLLGSVFLIGVRPYRWIMEAKIYGFERLRSEDRLFYQHLRSTLRGDDIIAIENRPRISFHCAFFSPVVTLPSARARTPEHLTQFLSIYQPKRILTTCYSQDASFLARSLDDSWQALPVSGHPDLMVWRKKSF